MRTLIIIIDILSLITFYTVAEIDHYSYKPSSIYIKRDNVKSYNTLQPSKAAYFVGSLHNLNKKLSSSLRKNQKTKSTLKFGFVNSVKHGKQPITKVHLPSVEPMLNSESSEVGKKQSLGVNGFTTSQNEPRPIDFGFLPVFPWPEKVPMKVSHLFPKSGQNELGWRVPSVNDSLSHFPSLNSNNNPQRFNNNRFPQFTTTLSPHRYDYAKIFKQKTTTTTTTTLTPPQASTTKDHIWDSSMLNMQPTFPTLLPSIDQDFQVEFATSTTPIPPPTTTTIKPIKKSNPQPPGVEPPDWVLRNSRKVHSWSQGPRRDDQKSMLLKHKKFRDPTPNKKDFDYSVIQKYKPSKCRTLNPLTDSVPHPHTDSSCEQGFPGWSKDLNCRCTFLVASRNFLGCATKYHTLCWRI